MKRRQPVRLLKLTCDHCGYNLWTSRRWLKVAVPPCPDPDCVGDEMVVQKDATRPPEPPDVDEVM